MAPPHTRFKPSFHNRLSHLSRHLFNRRAESRHSSIKTVIPVHEDDDLNSSDRPRNISVDGLNQGLILPEEPKIDHIDCTSSENHLPDVHACSMISSFEAGNFAVGSPRHVKEPHVARQSVIHSTSAVVQGTTVSATYHAAVTPLSTSPSPTSTSSTHTPSPSTTTSTNSSSQLSTTTTPQTSPQQSPVTSSSHTVYPTLPSPSDKPTDTPTSDTPITTATTTSPRPVLASATASLDGTVIISSPLAQSTSAPDTNSDPQSPPSQHTAAIAGGVIGAIALLALLIFIAIWYHRKRHRHSVTPFILPSTTETTPVEPVAWLKFHSIGDAVRPSSGGPLSPQYSDACLAEYGNRYPSFVADPVSLHLPSDDDVFASTRIAQRQRANGLEKLYPYPPRARTSGHYCRSGVENWIEQVVMEMDGSREPSEVLPEYRSAKSLRSGEADDDDDYVLPSSYPPLP